MVLYIIKVVTDVLLLGFVLFLMIYVGYKIYNFCCGGGEDAEDLETEDSSLMSKISNKSRKIVVDADDKELTLIVLSDET